MNNSHALRDQSENLPLVNDVSRAFMAAKNSLTATDDRPAKSALADITNFDQVKNVVSDKNLRLNAIQKSVPKSCVLDDTITRHTNDTTPPTTHDCPPTLQEYLKRIYQIQCPYLEYDKKYDVDEEDFDIPIMVAPYAATIYAMDKCRELKLCVRNDYMKHQLHINEKMRLSLVDWLIAVHDIFKLFPETLHLTIYLLDKTLSRYSVPIESLQLIGVTSMFIASKYQELTPPECDDFVYICKKKYTRENVISMEKYILDTVEYNLNVPSPIHFLRRYSKVIGNDHVLHTLAKYFIEMGFCIYTVALWPPSILASASLYLARRITGQKKIWNDSLKFHTSLKGREASLFASDLLDRVHTIFDAGCEHVKDKYASERFYKVAKIPLPEWV